MQELKVGFGKTKEGSSVLRELVINGMESDVIEAKVYPSMPGGFDSFHPFPSTMKTSKGHAKFLAVHRAANKIRL